METQVPLQVIVAKLQEMVGAQAVEIAALRGALDNAHSEINDLRALIPDTPATVDPETF